MRILCSILCSGLCAIATGCAQLDARIAIFDQHYFPYGPQMVKSVERYATDATSAEKSGSFNRARRDFKVTLLAKIEPAVKAAGPAVDPNEAGGLVNGWVADVLGIADAEFAVAREKRREGLNWYDRARASEHSGEVHADFRKAWVSFTEADLILRRLPRVVGRKVELLASTKTLYAKVPKLKQSTTGLPAVSDGGGPEPQGTAQEPTVAVAAAAQASQQATEDLVIGTGLQANPIASYIVTSPEAAWSRSINKAGAFGGFGNTDIALRLQSNNEFTIKGVRVDADKVTKATFSVVKQAVQLIAAANGIPVHVSTAAPSGGAGAGTSGSSNIAGPAVPVDSSVVSQVSGARATAAKSREQVRQARLAVFQTFDAVTSQTAALEDTKAGADVDQRRKAAIDSIKSTFDALKGQFSPPDSTSSSSGVSGATPNTPTTTGSGGT